MHRSFDPISPLRPNEREVLRHSHEGITDPQRFMASLKLLGIKVNLMPRSMPRREPSFRVRLDLCTLCTHPSRVKTAYISGRIPRRVGELILKQARAARTSKSNLVARYVIEKSIESEFPGIAFRDSDSGREAHIAGRRVAVWEVVDVHRTTKTTAKTADYFGWPEIFVQRALAYAKAFPDEIESFLNSERHDIPAPR